MSKDKAGQGGDTLCLSHSRLLRIIDFPEWRKVEIGDPWNEGLVLHTYYLVAQDAPHHVAPPEDGTTLRVPIGRIVSMTTVHASLAFELGCGENLVGLAESQWLKNPTLRHRIEEGLLSDVGQAMEPDVETIMEMESDAVLVSPFENSGGYGHLGEAGVALIECADYMEASALGRAEWIKFYGMLLGKEEKADSLFRETEAKYEALKGGGEKRKVMCDLPWRGTWYMPAGESTFGRLIADAGALYAYADDKRSGSIARSMEDVVDRCGDADIWIIRSQGPETLETIKARGAAFEALGPVRSRRVYQCDTMETPYYEETPFHPDLLLLDILRIINGEGNLRYFKAL